MAPGGHDFIFLEAVTLQRLRQIRTDMAREALARHTGVAGVEEQKEERGGIAVSRIRIVSEEGARRLDKPIGTYVTLETTGDMLTQSDALARCISEELAALLSGVRGHVLVVGLGNREVTPDSLGPRTAEKLFVTRHIRAFAPELAPDGMRDVSAIVPGVLGVTGLETVEVVRGVVTSIRPEAVLCIDALCSERAERITDVVQLNDSGLLPGAGVGNRQQGLNRETLGVPVYALGVPTVVYASAIAAETIRQIEQKTGVADEAASLSSFAEELIAQRMGDLIVTPKEIDRLIEDASARLANGINRALHAAHYEELHALLSH